MAVYSQDEDLLVFRADALRVGGDDLGDLHREAHDLIFETLESQWFRDQAVEHGYDPDETRLDDSRLDTVRLRRLACYKVLELVYQQQCKLLGSPDGAERQRDHFRGQYDAELQRLMVTGLGYDWDYGGSISTDERYSPRIRRLKRC